VANVFRGVFTNEKWYEVFKNEEPFDHERSLKVRNHSPTGFAWGYYGSGPSQLALGILLEETTREEAERFYMDYKHDVTAGLPKEEGQEWMLTSNDVQEWLRQKRTKHEE
jgi:hypothetical protein